MVIKTIKTSAKPIAEQVSMQPFSHGALGICGRQFSAFAKAVLDRYTKVLHYQFDYTSLVFLEQAAGAGEDRKAEYHNTVIVTWKLLSFLLQNANPKTEKKQFLYQNPVLLQQMITRLENNLLEIRLTDKRLYQDMHRCYEIYQNGAGEYVSIQNTAASNTEWIRIHDGGAEQNSYSSMIDYVEQQIRINEEKQQTGALLKKEKEQKTQFMAPFTMSRSFFSNLNHLVKENRVANYKQIWQQSVSQQLEQYYLDLHMQKFAKEQDMLKKEEMVFQMFQEFGSEKIQECLEKADESVYQQFVHVMYILAGSKDGSRERIEYTIQGEGKSDSTASGKNKRLEAYGREYIKEEKTEKENKSADTERYQYLQRELIFAEYKDTEQRVMDILQDSGEITRNIVLEKAEEYKELFYQYMNSTLNEQNVLEQKKQETDNPEIFTDEEIELLLNVDDGKTITEETQFLRKKLNLIAIKEITESFLAENTGFLEKERLLQIQKTLENISFSSHYLREEKQSQNGESESGLQESIRNAKATDTSKETKQEKDKNNFSLYNITQTFETGGLSERKLLYLALEHTIDKIIIENNNEEEQGQKEWTQDNQSLLQKELIQLKQKMIQPADLEKRLAGDWRFLMTKQKGKDMIESISKLSPEIKTQVEKMVQKEVEEFCYYLKQTEEVETKASDGNVFYESGNPQLITKSESGQKLLEEWKPFLQKEDIRQLYQIISKKKKISEEVSYQTIKKKLQAAKEQAYLKKEHKLERATDTQKEMKQGKNGKLAGKVKQNGRNVPKEVKEYQWISAKLQNRIRQIQIDNTKNVLSMHTEDTTNRSMNGMAEIGIRGTDKNNFSLYNITQTFETGGLSERKLLYLALEHTIDKIIIENNNEEEQGQQQKEWMQDNQSLLQKEVIQNNQSLQRKELIQLKQKMIQPADLEKRSAGDWRFLMTKQKGEEIIQSIVELQPEIKLQLEEMVQKEVEEFCYSLKQTEEAKIKDSEGKVMHELRSHALENNASENNTPENNTSRNHQSGKQQLITKSEEGRKLLEEWKAFLQKEDMKQLYQLISKEKEEVSYQKTKKELLPAKNMEENGSVFKHTKFYKVTKNMKLSDVIQVFETGNLPERKLMYLVLRGAFSSMEKKVERKTGNNQQKEKSGRRTSVTDNHTKEQIHLKKEHISKIKEVIFQDTDEMEIADGTWKFLFSKERNKRFIETVIHLQKTESDYLEKHMAEQVNVFYRELHHLQRKDEIHNKEESNYNRKQIREKWNLLFEKEEQEILLHSKNILNTYNLKNNNAKTKMAFTKTTYSNINTKKVNKKLQLRQLYDTIISRNYQIKALKVQNFEKNEDEVYKHSFSHQTLAIKAAEEAKIYQISRQLNRKEYQLMENDITETKLLTQRNQDFMQPPVEQQAASVKDKNAQVVLSEKMKYHEESIKLILNHTKDKTAPDEKEYQKADRLEQEKMLRKLEGSLLDYRAELEDKSERLEMVEKQLQNQEKKFKLLKETQASMSKSNVRPEESRQFIKHLQEEIKMEQMRRGKI